MTARGRLTWVTAVQPLGLELLVVMIPPPLWRKHADPALSEHRTELGGKYCAHGRGVGVGHRPNCAYSRGVCVGHCPDCAHGRRVGVHCSKRAQCKMRREIPLWSPRRIPHILNVHSEKDSTHSQDTAAPLAHKVPLHLEQQNAVTLVKCRYNSRPKEMSSENVSSAQGSLSMIAHTAKQLTLVLTRRGRQDPMPSSTHLAAARSAMWPQHVQDVGTECVHVPLALLALASQPRPPS
eukprot:scaffold7411_cov58-Phaeocystis_antarctica.AAC.2